MDENVVEKAVEKKSSKQVGDENRQRILDIYGDYVEEHGKAPTITYLVETVKLSRPIIYKHLKNLQVNELAQRFKPRAISILEGVAKRAEQGDYQCAKLILQLAFNWNEKKILETTSTNKSLKVIFTNPDRDTMKKIVENNIENTEYTEEVDDTDTE